MFISNRYKVNSADMQPGKYKMKVIPGLLRPFINTRIRSIILSEWLYLITLAPISLVPFRHFVISPFRLLNTPLKIEIYW